MRSRRDMEFIAGRVGSTGVAYGVGDDFTVRKSGTGRYLVDFPDDFVIISAFANGQNATNLYTIAPIVMSPTQIEFWATGPGPTQVDISFNFIAVGVKK